MANNGPGFSKYPGYSVTPETIQGEVEVRLNDTLLCKSRNAIWVQESRHKPALYLPRAEVSPELLVASETDTYCPFKGTASYYGVRDGAAVVDDLLWYYPEPFDEVAFIADYLGLYQQKVSSIRIDGAPLA